MPEKIQKIKDQFSDTALFERALTHRSWVNENAGERRSNERLEFLGDAVLEFVVSDVLYRKFTGEEEGFLTNLRANIVNTTNLAEVARRLELGPMIYLSKGEAQGGGHDNNSLLADTVESIIGAVYIDQGFTAAEKFIKDEILSDLEQKSKEPLKDPKSLLQEKVQAKGYATPKYRVLSEEGPDHDKTFEVEVIIDGKSAAKGTGRSKSVAEQDAASAALEKNGYNE